MRLHQTISVATVLLVTHLVYEPVLTAADNQSHTFSITVHHPEDTVKVDAEEKRTCFSIRSPRGIGQAVIQREADSWPEKIAIHLHLKGLEGFRISDGATTLHASVSSSGVPLIRTWKGNEEDKPLDSKSPYWLNIKLVDQDGNPATEIPLKKGVIELQVPAALISNAPEKLTVHWIDFYRG